MKLKVLLYCLCITSILGCKRQADKEQLYDIEERIFVNTNYQKGTIDSIKYIYISKPQSTNNELLIHKTTYISPKSKSLNNNYPTKYYICQSYDIVYIASPQPFENEERIYFSPYYRLDSKEKYQYRITDKNNPPNPPLPHHMGYWELVSKNDSSHTIWGEACSKDIRFEAYYRIDKYLRVDSIYNNYLNLKLEQVRKYQSGEFNDELHFDKLSF